MEPDRNEGCSCGKLEAGSKDPTIPINWDECVHSYSIAFGKRGNLAVYYCPFCGGKLPRTSDESSFVRVTEEEKNRIRELFRDVRTVDNVLARFGPPEREFIGGSNHRPERDGKPGGARMFRALYYENLSPVANIYFGVGRNNSVRGGWMRKFTRKRQEGKVEE